MVDRHHWRLRRRGIGSIIVTGGLIAVLLAALVALWDAGGDAAGNDDAWNLTGPLLAWNAEMWIVDGTPVIVPERLDRGERHPLGSIVTASGGWDERGQRVATNVEVRPGPLPVATLPEASISGTIAEIDGTRWQVAGTEVFIPAGTTFRVATEGVDPGALQRPGALVEISGYRLDDGRVLAVEIALVDAPDAQPPTAHDAPPAPTDAAADVPADPPAGSDDQAEGRDHHDNGHANGDDKAEDKKNKGKDDNGRGNGKNKDKHDRDGTDDKHGDD
jgi:hypothetical protein